jgi:hypothetical protein
MRAVVLMMAPPKKCTRAFINQAAAVRLGPDGLPIILEKTWRKFRLTFETEHDFPLDFLVNGDFESSTNGWTLAARYVTRSRFSHGG